MDLKGLSVFEKSSITALKVQLPEGVLEKRALSVVQREVLSVIEGVCIFFKVWLVNVHHLDLLLK